MQVGVYFSLSLYIYIDCKPIIQLAPGAPQDTFMPDSEKGVSSNIVINYKF